MHGVDSTREIDLRLKLWEGKEHTGSTRLAQENTTSNTMRKDTAN